MLNPQNNDIWRIKNGFAPQARDNNEIAIAFRPDFFISYVLGASDLHQTSAAVLETKALERISRAEAVDFDLADIQPKERRQVLQTVNRKIRDARFRANVLRAYSHRCCVCGVQLDLLDAAHIILTATESQEIVLLDVDKRDPKEIIQLKDLLSGDFAYLASFDKPLQDKIRIYKNRIESYQFSSILMKDAAIDVATEVFTRLNVGGEPLSVFEIMVAKTYDAEKGFDLSEKFAALIVELETVDYDTLSSATVLQTVSVLLRKDCRKKEILNLPKSEFIAIWPAAIEAIRAAVDYFRGYYRIPVSKLLPYAGLVIPFAYFFFKHPDKPDAEQKKRLEDFFWRVSLAGRYSQALETRIFQDIQRIDKILEGKDSDCDWAIDTSATFIQNNGYFSVSRSYIKSLLCLLAFRQPKSFEDNSIVHLDNAWLKQANSKNYHHFFPKAWLAQQGEQDWRANHIANITLVDDYLNKRVIRAKPPGVYILVFQQKNAQLAQCLSDHLIELTDQFGVLQNDYAKFFNARCEALSTELQKRIIPRDIDSKLPAHAAEDTAEEEPEWETT